MTKEEMNEITRKSFKEEFSQREIEDYAMAGIYVLAGNPHCPKVLSDRLVSFWEKCEKNGLTKEIVDQLKPM